MSNVHGLGLKQIAGNSAVTLGRQVVAGLLQLATVVIIARVLGPTGNGQYAVALLLPTMLVSLFNLGIAPANVYFLGAGKVDILTVLKAINRLTFPIVIAGLSVGTLCIQLFSKTWFPGIPQIFLWGALSLFPFVLFQSFLSSIFQGLQKFHIFNLILLTQPTVTLCLILLLVLFNILSLKWVLVAHLLGFIVVVIVSLLKIKVEIALQNSSDNQQGYVKQVINYGYKAHLSNILTFVNYKADIFLVNLFVNPSAAGIYVVAVQIVERLWILSQSVSTVILPCLSELSDDEEKRKQVTPIICRTIIASTIILAVILASIAYPFIAIVFGAEYLKAILPLIFLLPGIVAGAGARILANDIAARGRPELNMYLAIIVVTVNVVGNILLIPIYKLQGAAVATSFAYLLNFFLCLIVYKRVSGNGLITSIIINTNDLARIVDMLRARKTD